jgi:hypothetical protein
MKKPTLRERYEWLCKQFAVRDLDYWERDGLLTHPGKSIYFQIPNSVALVDSVDKAVILAMQTTNVP